MSLQQTINYDDINDFTTDTDKVEIDVDKAQLKLLSNPGQVFTEDFADDTGFTYDSDKAEFTGGLVRQKDQRPDDATFGANYNTNINGNWGEGILTGTATGGASVSGAKLDCTGESIKYVDYDANLNADSQQVGAIRFKVTPNYSGAPTSPKQFFAISKTHGFNDNAIKIFQLSTLIYIQIADSTGSTIVSSAESWTPVSGVTYEIELNWDITTGATRLFIDGIQKGSTHTGTGIRSSDIGLFRIGADQSASLKSDFYIDDLVVFSTVQHTSNYTPGSTVPELPYLETSITAPEMENTNPGTLISFDSFTATDSNDPRYTIQVGRSGNYLYWDGADWSVSDGSYSQASDATTFNANVGDLDILGETYCQFKIHFEGSNDQQSVSEINASLTNQQYCITDPSIMNTSGVFADAITAFAATVTETGSDTVTFLIRKGTINYWFDGSEWSVSDGTVAESNTAAEIEANKASLDLSGGFNIYIVALLHSDDGTTTPSISQVVFSYGFQGSIPTTPSKCYVYAYLKDIVGDGKTGTLIITNTKSWKYDDSIIMTPDRQSIAFDTDGYCELQVIETATDSKKYLFEIEYTNHNDVTKTITLGYAEVPNAESKDISTLSFTSDLNY